MDYPLKTTGDIGSLSNDLIDIKKGKRNFIWYHVKSSEFKNTLLIRLKSYDLEILPTVDYYVLACRKNVSLKTRKLMVLDVLPNDNEKIAKWKGKQFGYTKKEIDWYLSQLRKTESIRQKYK